MPHLVAHPARPAAKAANSSEFPTLLRYNRADDRGAAGRTRNAVSLTVVPRTLRAPRRARPAPRLGSGRLRRTAACPISLPQLPRLPAATAGAGTTRRSAVSSRPRRPRTILPPPSHPSPRRRHTPRPRLSPPSPLLLALAQAASGCTYLFVASVPECRLTLSVNPQLGAEVLLSSSRW